MGRLSNTAECGNYLTLTYKYEIQLLVDEGRAAKVATLQEIAALEAKNEPVPGKLLDVVDFLGGPELKPSHERLYPSVDGAAISGCRRDYVPAY